MKLRPGGGIITPLVQVKGSIPPESAAAIVAGLSTLLAGASAFAAAAASTCAGAPVSATHEAPAAATNNSRREILFPMIALAPRIRDACRSPRERRALYTVNSRPAPARRLGRITNRIPPRHNSSRFPIHLFAILVY